MAVWASTHVVGDMINNGEIIADFTGLGPSVGLTQSASRLSALKYRRYG